MNMLPSDRYLCSLLGITEEEFIKFKAAARQHLKENPIEGPVAGTETAVTLAIINLVLGIGTLAVSLLLRPSIPEQGKQGEIKQTEQIDDPILSNQNFAPRYGFDSVQNVTKLGSAVPLVYAKRGVDGAKVGGVRVNMPIIWSQMLSFGTSQMLRGVFLASESEIGDFDKDLWAIGSNLLKNYKFDSSQETQAASRATVYVSKEGGAILEGDRVFGRSGSQDRRTNGGGSSATSATEEVFKVQTGSGLTETAAFSAVHTPSSNTEFGVYSFIGNDLAYKVNPVVEAGCKLQQVPKGTDNVRIKCPYDEGRITRRLKYINNYSGFSGIYKKNGTAISSNGSLTLSKNDTVTYGLFHQSEKEIKFRQDSVEFDELSKDIASSVAARQTQYDQNLVVGELYKIGSAIGVLTSRSNSVFRSEAEEIAGVGTSIDATFKIVESGVVQGYTEAHLKGRHGSSTQQLTIANISSGNVTRAVATNNGHILRYAQAVVTNTRPCNITEIGISSVLGNRINGLCNFKDTKTYQEADNLICTAVNNTDYDSNEAQSSVYRSGTVTVSFPRYSCFTVQYKELIEETDGDWIDSGEIFAAHSETQQAVFNFIRFEFSTERLRIFRLRPLSGFEIRAKTSGKIFVLDALEAFQYRSISAWGSGSYAGFKGKVIQYGNFHNTFRSKFNEAGTELDANYTKVRKDTSGQTDSLSYLGLPQVDTSGSNYDSFVDDYMKLAEAFVYNEISSSASSKPEHRVAYVNEIVTGQTGTYSNLALVGINIRSSTEWQQFTQFSGYVRQGIKARRLSQYSSGATFTDPSPASIFHFPDILLDLLTNETYGTGAFIKDEMIDLAEFKAAREFCDTRGYFFNGVLVDQINLRQFATDTAATHLLFFAEINGKYVLRPAFPVHANNDFNNSGVYKAADVKALFTVGNIIKDSYSIEYLNPEDRESIEVSVTFREERTGSNIEGGFSVVRERLVKEKPDGVNVAETFETVQIDMTNYCTQQQHAEDAAKFIIRMRRLSDHVIKFKTTYEALICDIAPGDYINVAMDATEYQEFNNGVVTDSGALTSTEPLADGTYTVYAWDPTSGNDPASQTLTVSNNGTTATPTGIVFTEIVNTQNSRTYQIERITADQDGTFTIEAMHMPLTSSGVPKAVDQFDNSAYWDIT